VSAVIVQLGYGLRSVFATRRGLRSMAANTLVALGVTATVIQVAAPLLPAAVLDSGWLIAVTGLLCFSWGVARTYPQRRLEHTFRHSDTTVVIEIGDLLAAEADLVIGFSDTFDTATRDDLVISRASLQGQVLHQFYADDAARLDRELDAVLAAVPPAGVETRRTKPHGKLVRYPVGTVAVLNQGSRRIYGLAYSRMGNDDVARSSVANLWLSLDKLWDAVYRHSQRGHVAIPLMGAFLARIDELDAEALLKMILLSFAARSRSTLLCCELRVVIRPADIERIKILEVAAFVRAL
jgi:hypothetical protein